MNVPPSLVITYNDEKELCPEHILYTNTLFTIVMNLLHWGMALPGLGVCRHGAFFKPIMAVKADTIAALEWRGQTRSPSRFTSIIWSFRA